MCMQCHRQLLIIVLSTESQGVFGTEPSHKKMNFSVSCHRRSGVSETHSPICTVRLKQTHLQLQFMSIQKFEYTVCIFEHSDWQPVCRYNIYRLPAKLSQARHSPTLAPSTTTCQSTVSAGGVFLRGARFLSGVVAAKASTASSLANVTSSAFASPLRHTLPNICYGHCGGQYFSIPPGKKCPYMQQCQKLNPHFSQCLPCPPK
jgi:hypothetical protein